MRSMIFLFFCVLVYSQLAIADELDAINAVSRNQIVEEVLHPFVKKTYSTAWVVGKKMPQIDTSKPEHTFAKWIIAMKEANFDAAFEQWDTKSKEMILLSDKQENRIKEDWQREWTTRFSSKIVMVKEKVEYGSYVLIPYYLVDKKGGQVLAETVSLKKVNGRWLLTLDLVGNPVISNWQSGDKRTQRLSDAVMRSQ